MIRCNYQAADNASLVAGTDEEQRLTLCYTYAEQMLIAVGGHRDVDGGGVPWKSIRKWLPTSAFSSGHPFCFEVLLIWKSRGSS